MSFLSDEIYSLVEQSVPLACVDFVPVRADASGAREVGLILRDSPFGRVWCHCGGRVRRGETIAAALQRHAVETLGVGLRLGVDPQPDYVYQWFPPELVPPDAGVYGDDPRKHAVGLSFVVETLGEVEVQTGGEAIAFAWFAEGEWPEPLWPGCEALLTRILAS